MTAEERTPEQAYAAAFLASLVGTREALYGTHEYPDYLVTADGRVFSVRTRRFLKPIKMGAYLGVQIKDCHGNSVKRYVHRLVLEIFAGPCPPGMEARHLNGARSDNHLLNLQWGTRAENAADKVTHGTSGHGERNPQARLTWANVAQIRSRVVQGETQRALARELGVAPMTVSRVVRGESWAVSR